MRITTTRGLGLAAGLLVGLVALGWSPGGRPAAPVDRPAPEITGGPWINSAPLSLAVLAGRVVLVEFWTYG
jgi:hypothetical protein